MDAVFSHVLLKYTEGTSNGYTSHKVKQMPIDPQLYERLMFFVYLAMGIPVAWMHIRQQNMVDSVRQAHTNRGVKFPVVLLLASLWPLLLFCMALNARDMRKRLEKLKSTANKDDGARSELHEHHRALTSDEYTS